MVYVPFPMFIEFLCALNGEINEIWNLYVSFGISMVQRRIVGLSLRSR